VFDLGKRRAAVRAGEAELAQAEENLQRLKDQVAVGIQRDYDKLERTRNLVAVAKQFVELRQESERLAQNQLSQGVVLGVRPPPKYRCNVQGTGGLPASELGLSPRLGRTRASRRAHPRTLNQRR